MNKASFCMRNASDGYGYNERLFSGGLRGYLHTARFRFVNQAIKKFKIDQSRILELGCFDGKLVDHLPQEPSEYYGFDANWEGGLDLARKKWAGKKNLQFFQATRPADMAVLKDMTFPLCVSMETIEHIPTDIVDGYLDKLAALTNGHIIITVPNEKGPLLLAKWMAKSILSKSDGKYTPAELLNATLGRMDRVGRDEHKGFDYDALIRQLDKRFEILEVSGHPLGGLPLWMCFGVGIVARSRGLGRG
jgi:cyclopropane fatty-acyl-phospholipid synthase-like methyltransferase